MKIVGVIRGLAISVSRLGLLLLLPLVVGCGPGEGKVSGRVLFNGKGLPGGRVTFRPADPKQNAVSAELDEQGNYAVTLPTGEVKVSVDNRELEPRPQGGAQGGVVLPPGLAPDIAKKLGGGKPPESQPKSPENFASKGSGRYVKIPTKYHDGEKSGLQFKVQSGNQVHDIELDK